MSKRELVKAAAGALLFATMVYAILAAPGLLADTASIVPVTTQQARR